MSDDKWVERLRELLDDPTKRRQFFDRGRLRRRKEKELKEATEQRQRENRVRDEMRRDRKRYE